MIRIINAHDVVTGQVKYYEFAGTSLDDKPTENVCTGSSFLEADTGHVFFYDEDSQTWIQAGSNSSEPQ